jgi:hypothetical protein
MAILALERLLSEDGYFALQCLRQNIVKGRRAPGSKSPQSSAGEHNAYATATGGPNRSIWGPT